MYTKWRWIASVNIYYNLCSVVSLLYCLLLITSGISWIDDYVKREQYHYHYYSPSCVYAIYFICGLLLFGHHLVISDNLKDIVYSYQLEQYNHNIRDRLDQFILIENLHLNRFESTWKLSMIVVNLCGLIPLTLAKTLDLCDKNCMSSPAVTALAYSIGMYFIWNWLVIGCFSFYLHCFCVPKIVAAIE